MLNNRHELGKYFAELGFKTGAEIGVYGGHYSRYLLNTIPDLKLYSIDSWMGKYWKHELAARRILAGYPGCTIIKGMSVDVAKTIPDNSLDFVYIDANHTPKCVSEDIIAWEPKVRQGGIVSGHDYQLPDVRSVVDNYVGQNSIELFITLQHTNKEFPSWYFIK